ncbi:MAG: hypothetical protein MJE68_18815, partial [Proteobacteria bacterium]|nr:hypothetical protein [Pseudomonadota bacterium]
MESCRRCAASLYLDPSGVALSLRRRVQTLNRGCVPKAQSRAQVHGGKRFASFPEKAKPPNRFRVT